MADRVVSLLPFAPDGRGSGADLLAGVAGNWQFMKESGEIPAKVNLSIEDVVYIRFLPRPLSKATPQCIQI